MKNKTKTTKSHPQTPNNDPHTNNNTRNCGRFSAKSSGRRQGVKKLCNTAKQVTLIRKTNLPEK